MAAPWKIPERYVHAMRAAIGDALLPDDGVLPPLEQAREDAAFVSATQGVSLVRPVRRRAAVLCPGLSVPSDLLDAIHRAAAMHVAAGRAPEHARLNGSALLALGVLCEEMLAEDLADHLGVIPRGMRPNVHESAVLLQRISSRSGSAPKGALRTLDTDRMNVHAHGVDAAELSKRVSRRRDAPHPKFPVPPLPVQSRAHARAFLARTFSVPDDPAGLGDIESESSQSEETDASDGSSASDSDNDSDDEGCASSGSGRDESPRLHMHPAPEVSAILAHYRRTRSPVVFGESSRLSRWPVGTYL